MLLSVRKFAQPGAPHEKGPSAKMLPWFVQVAVA